MTSLILSLMSRPFASRSSEEQVAIVLAGPPKFRLQPSSDGAQGNRLVDDGIYEQHKWLTGCAVLQRCFCWPCLLCAEDRDCPWTGKATRLVCDTRSLPVQLHSHETSVGHIEADLRLRLFRHEALEQRRRGEESSRLVEDARRRREGLEALVDVICGELVLDPLLNRERGLGRGPENARRYRDLMRESRGFLRGDFEGREKAEELVAQAPQMADFGVKGMATALKEETWKDAAESTYVAIVLNDHLDARGKRVVSTVLRFVLHDEPCERFVGFGDLAWKTAKPVFDHIVAVLNQFGVQKKLAAYAIDGGVLPVEELSGLVRTMKVYFPQAYFSHWHCHRFGELLLQGLCSLPLYEDFFRAMSSLRRFFYPKSKLVMVFEGLLKVRHTHDPQFSVKSLWGGGQDDLVCLTLKYRVTMLEFFRYIVQKPGQFRAEEVAMAYGFRRYLAEPNTVFLLCLLNCLSNPVAEFAEMLKVPRRFFESTRWNSLKTRLEQFKSTQFSAVSVAAGKEMSPFRFTSSEFRIIFDFVLDRLILQLQVRIKPWQQLRFCLLLQRNCWRPDASNQTTLFWRLLELLRVHFPQEDDLFLEFQRIDSAGFIYPTACFNALFKAFVSIGVRESLPNTFRLAELCLTLPMNPAPSPSTMLGAIQDWASCIDEEADRARALLGVESRLLYRLKDTEALKKLAQVFE